MRNIGPTSRQWLAELEIYTVEDLKQVGAISTWIHIKARHPRRVTKNLLWALLGAELDLDWRELPAEVKADALAMVEGSGGAQRPES